MTVIEAVSADVAWKRRAAAAGVIVIEDDDPDDTDDRAAGLYYPRSDDKRKLGQDEYASAKKACVGLGEGAAAMETFEVVERGADALEQATHAAMVQDEPTVSRERTECSKETGLHYRLRTPY